MSYPTDHNPMQHFQKWFHDTDRKYPQEETNAMALSTIGTDGFPKTRIVLLKKFTWEGFIFFTNYDSEKGRAIENNNLVSLQFNWSSAHKEVLISGKAEKIAKNQSEGYFESRPKGSKLGAWASQQSTIISSRKILDDNLTYYESKFKEIEIPKPDNWGGYLIKPQSMVFINYDPLINISEITTYRILPDYFWSKEVKYIPAFRQKKG